MRFKLVKPADQVRPRPLGAERALFPPLPSGEGAAAPRAATPLAASPATPLAASAATPLAVERALFPEVPCVTFSEAPGGPASTGGPLALAGAADLLADRARRSRHPAELRHRPGGREVHECSGDIAVGPGLPPAPRALAVRGLSFPEAAAPDPSPRAAPGPVRPALALSLIGLAAVAGMGLSVALAAQHEAAGLEAPVTATIRGVVDGPASDLASGSAVSEVLGRPLAVWGFDYFAALALLAVASLRESRPRALRWLLGLSVAGCAAGIGLLGHAYDVLGAACAPCWPMLAATLLCCVLSVSAVRRTLGSAFTARTSPEAYDTGVRGGWVTERTAAISARLAERRPLACAALAALAILGTGEALAAALRPPPRDEAGDLVRGYRATPPVRIDIAEAPARGALDPALSLVVFSDFLCPHCREASRALCAFVARHPDEVRLAVKHFPLDPQCNRAAPGCGHPGAYLLARAAAAAHAQGRFWPMFDALFGSQAAALGARMTRDEVLDLCPWIGLDRVALDAALDAPSTIERVRADVDEGDALALAGTPTVFANGRRLARVPSAEGLEALLREVTR